MKKILIALIPILMVFFIVESFAQKTAEVSIKTSAVCEMCKKRIERDLGLTKGIQSATLNLTDKVVTVKYKPSKTDAEKIKQAISNIGYDADEVVANQKSHDALPECCQKHNKEH